MTLGPAKIVQRPLKTEWCFHHEDEDRDQEAELIQPRDKSDFITRSNLELDQPGFTQGLVQYRQ